MHVCMYVNICIDVCVYTHNTHTHTHTHIYIYIYIYIYIHTHKFFCHLKEHTFPSITTIYLSMKYTDIRAAYSRKYTKHIHTYTRLANYEILI